MRNILLTILITLAFPQTQKIDVDIEKVLTLRSELPRDIIQILPDGSQTELGRCGFVELGNADRTFKNEEIEEWALNNPQTRDIAIPIAFHVIYASNGTGNLPESAVNDQVDVLNSSYAQWGLSFTLTSLDYTQNSSWFNNDSESQYKAQLAISPSTVLNIYTTTAGGYLGYAYLPQDYNESSYMHGVVLNYQSLPNVYNWEYDEGDTGVHEVGHYLGLHHTFQGSCTGNGDYVGDTPAQYDGDNVYNCWNMDTCPSNSGNDPIHNYMNYTDDACITEFTSGQSDRIAYMVETYKPSLGTQEGCADGYVDDCSGDGDCCAESWIGDGYGDCEDQQWGCDLTCYNNDGGDCSSDVYGCTDTTACNYNDHATADCDNCCEYSEENYDCNGNCLVELDCTGNCCVIGENGCYWQETGPCGEPGPSNGMDECGVCGGDNSSCMTCAGVPCSDAYIDNCGTCDDDPTNDCVQGCDGIWGGGSELDECGICDGDGSSCADSDGDGCIDDIDDAPFEWDDDYDGDAVPDDCDADDDNDGVADASDSDDNNEYVCSDVDMDTCDDCSSGTFDPENDGPDYNANGMCDEGDINDTDGDGVIDDEDSDPFNPYQCADNDGDGCDDCSTGYYDPSNDGWDYDGDGACDLGDDDDDNDGVPDSEDCHPFDPTLSEYDCCGVCGGDNASCSNCCGIPFNDDCTSDCYEGYITGDCCLIGEVDECGICYGDGSSCQVSGDVNGDGLVNVIDVVMIVGFIMGTDTPDNAQELLADMNSDGLINVIDVVMLVDTIMSGGF